MLRTLILLVSLGLTWASESQSANDTPAPNIVLIFIDDMGWTDLSCYGSDLHRTPHTDRLAAEGMRFTNAYAAAHICSPTRAALMTGLSPATMNLTDWIPGHPRHNERLSMPDWSHHMPQGQPTLGEILGDAGYTTAWLGKWHLSEEPGDYFDVVDPAWNRNTNQDREDPKGVFSLTRQAIDFIEANRDGPFFLGLSHFSVHTPVRFNPEVRDRYRALVRRNGLHTHPGYAAMVEALDDSVGQLLDYLDDAGLTENTIVIFTSDNGGLDPRPTNNDPLREGKGHLYEGGTRVPLIVRWPGHVEAGAVQDVLVTTVDFLPTFAGLAGVDSLPDNLEGVDLRGLWLQGDPLAERALYWHYPHYHRGMPSSSIRVGDFKLIEFFETGQVELYNLANDPGEQRNLAQSQPEQAQAMLEQLQAWRDRVGAQMMQPNPNFQP